jgi:hypothetical protein
MSVNPFPSPLKGVILENGRRVQLLSTFRFVDGDVLIAVPKGFTSDWNSTPRALWWWFPPWEYPEAGIIHDFLYRHPGTFDRERCDQVHRRVLELKGMRRSKREAAYLGLRLGGWLPWNRYRNGEPT